MHVRYMIVVMVIVMVVMMIMDSIDKERWNANV